MLDLRTVSPDDGPAAIMALSVGDHYIDRDGIELIIRHIVITDGTITMLGVVPAPASEE